MKPIFKTVCAALVLAAFAAPSFADGRKNDDDNKKHVQVPQIKKGDFDRPGSAHSVPEINGAGASLALALLGGVVLIMRERRKS
ncbi:MYXO-CTERM sorting domain-containing protein [Rhodoferax lacus]|nr:MYXO-CTERM sorting domain-containing protein [Rhodoferax lacus]